MHIQFLILSSTPYVSIANDFFNQSIRHSYAHLWKFVNPLKLLRLRVDLDEVFCTNIYEVVMQIATELKKHMSKTQTKCDVQVNFR